MSRSALWRQEGAKNLREKEAEDLFHMAVEEGRNNPMKGLLPLWGPDDSFHFNPMLLQKIIKSSYFQKCCRDITDWNTLVDEVYYQAKHLEPWAVGGEPSNAFCLLLRLLTLRCSEKQMKLLLDHVDSPYIRGIGFLYLRFAGEPKTIWKWIDPYLYDDEPITVTATVNKNKTQRNRQQQNETTIGDFVRRLFSSERDYYGTMLPRIPIQVERELQVKLLFAERIQERVKKHISNRKTMDYFQTLGSRVMALYGDEENPIQWYEAVVDRVVTRNEETSRQLETPKFTVTFTEYGNTETVTLGEMEMRGAALDSVKKELPVRGGGNHQSSQQKYDDMRGRTDQPRDRGYDRAEPSDYDRRGYTNSDSSDRRYYERGDNESRRGYAASRYDDANSRSATALPSDDDLYEEVRRRERANVTARGNQPVARRPPSAKASLTGPYRRTAQGSSINPHPPPARAPTYQERKPSHSTPAPASLDSSSQSALKKRSAEEIAAVQDKKRKLMAKYG